MKTKLIVTLVAVSTLSLACTFAYFLNTSAPNKSTGPDITPLPPRAEVTTRPLPIHAATAQAFTNFVRMDWNQVESDDYRKYVANLRAIECPEQTIRDIIVADVNKLFEARTKAIIGPKTPDEFWKRPQSRTNVEERVKQSIQLAKEKRAILKELLGPDVADKTPVLPSSSEPAERLAFLPKEKQDQVTELEATYRAKIQSLMGSKMRPTKADIETYKSLMAESESEIGKVLSPQELEDYQVRNSRTAEIMRMTLGDFDMTEQEFRNIFKIKKQFEDQYGMMMGMGPEDPQKVLARSEMEKQIRNMMGEQRYTDYTREQGWSTSSLQNVAQEYGVPKETAIKVFDLKPIAQEQAAKIQIDPSLSDAQKAQATQAVQQETVKAIGEIIGKEAADAYYRQGAWIRNLGGKPNQDGSPMH